MTEVTKEDMEEELENSNRFGTVLDSVGVDEKYLAKRLKKELSAHETKVFHDKGAKVELKECFRCKGTGKLDGKKCKLCKGSGILTISPILYSKKLIAWEIRQKARQDAHKLRGDYPAEKHDLDISSESVMAMVVKARQQEKKEPRKEADHEQTP